MLNEHPGDPLKVEAPLTTEPVEVVLNEEIIGADVDEDDEDIPIVIIVVEVLTTT